MSYRLSGNGTGNSTSTVALRGGDPITSTNYKTIAQAGTPEKLPTPPQPNAYSVVATNKQVVWVTTLEKLSTDKGVGKVTVGLWTTIKAAVILENQASGEVTVSAITLTLL